MIYVDLWVGTEHTTGIFHMVNQKRISHSLVDR